MSTGLRRTEFGLRGYTDGMLEQIRGPADLQHLSQSQLSDLAHEIRDFLIHKVAATGGHLGPNLGVVELTLALHRVFDSPHDPIVFDTGHQAYVHKMLTGRCGDFDSLRKKDGLSGYPSPRRERARLGRIQSRVLGTVLRRRSGQGVRADRTPQSARGRRRRRRRADRRNVLGGAQQHRGRQTTGGHRRQRQRPQLCADDRRAGRPPRRAAAAAGLREAAGAGAYRGARRAGHRRAVLPVHAQRQGRTQGRAVAAGHVHRPRPEVRRSHRRPRRARRRGRAAARPGLQRARHRPRRHPQGHGLWTRGGRRGRADALDRCDRPADRAVHLRGGPGLDGHLLRRTDQAGQEASRHRRDHRRHAGSDRAVAHSVSATPTGCSMSASPSSMR